MKYLKLFLTIVLIIPLTGCYNYRELNDLGITTAIGITKENNEYKLIIEVLKTDIQFKSEKNIDVAIVDIKLANNEDGNDVLAKMQDLCLRIPTVIHTGTPDDVRIENVLRVFKRGEGYSNIFNYLFDIYNTGIVNNNAEI